jgi:hypothetical protein
VSKQSIDDDDDLDPDEIVRASRDDHTAGDTSPGMTLMLLVMAHMPDDIAIGELFELLDEVGRARRRLDREGDRRPGGRPHGHSEPGVTTYHARS